MIEISVVESPADNNAHITTIKSAAELKDVEAVLRQKGFSQKEATEIVSKVKKIHGEREAMKASEEKTQTLKNFIKETYNV